MNISEGWSPKIINDPKLEGWVVIYGDDNTFAMKCELSQPPQGVQFEVKWYVDDGLGRVEIFDEVLEDRTDFAHLHQSHLQGHMGKQVAKYTPL